MKTLQKLTKLAFLFVALLAGTSAFAQQTQTSQGQGQGQGQGRARLSAEERAAMQLERYQKQLDLTPDQSTKIKAILTASAQEMEKMRVAGGRPDRAVMQAEAQKRATEINAVLTPVQQEKFAKILAEQLERQNNGGGPGQGGGQRRANSQGNR